MKRKYGIDRTILRMHEDLLLYILFISFKRVLPVVSYTMTGAKFFPQKLLWKNSLALYIFDIIEL